MLLLHLEPMDAACTRKVRRLLILIKINGARNESDAESQTDQHPFNARDLHSPAASIRGLSRGTSLPDQLIGQTCIAC